MSSAVRIARYAPLHDLAAHSHDRARLCLVLRGGFEEGVGRQAREHRPGDLLYRPVGLVHAQRFAAPGASCALIDPGDVWLAEARAHRIAIDRPACVTAPDATRIGAVLDRECADWDEFSPLSCEAVAWECLALLGRCGGRAEPAAQPALTRAIDFLRANLERPVGLSQAARAAGVHPATLSRQIRRTLGESVGAHLRRLRVERAAELLQATAMPIAEIALVCGFASQAHLGGLFRRAMGVTPARFRQLRRA